MTNISDDGVNGKTCPAGWDLFHDNCFIYVNEPLIWDDARARCQAMSEFDICFIWGEAKARCHENGLFLLLRVF